MSRRQIARQIRRRWRLESARTAHERARAAVDMVWAAIVNAPDEAEVERRARAVAGLAESLRSER